MSEYIKQLVKAAALFNDAYYEARKQLAQALSEETKREVDLNSQGLIDMIDLTNPAEVDGDPNAAKDFIEAAQAGDFMEHL